MKKLFFALIWTFVFSPLLIAQNTVTIKGTVQDDSGVPLVGASIVAIGTNKGVSTDLNGSYTIEVGQNVRSLKFMFLGYFTQVVEIKEKRVIDVTMKEDAANLEELVVIGYGQVKKRDLTGAVSSVKIDGKQAAAVLSPDALLQGRVPGVYVTAANSAPGGAINVRIRGTATLNGNSEPLYVVDGVIQETAMEDVSNTMSGGTQGSSTVQEVQNGLTSVNPQDIESIEVLKDASATAIYGSRASNGVVIITTKRGATSKTKINLTSFVDISKLAKTIPMLSGAEYVQYRNEKSTTPVFTDSDNLEYVNWQKELTRSALTQNYHLTASGASDKVNYYMAAGYMDNEGVVKTTGVEQYDFRTNIVFDLTKRLKATTRYNIIKRINNMTTGTDQIGGANTSMIRQMICQAPIVNISEFEDENKYTPNAWITDYVDRSKENRSVASLALDYKLDDVFTLHLFGGYDNREKQRSRWYGKSTYTGATANGQLGIAKLNTQGVNLEAMLYFDKNFRGDHHLSGTAGVTYDKKNSEQYQMVNENFFTEVLGIYGMGYGDTSYPNNSYFSNYQTFSALSRINYSYKDKYLLTITGRMDGSSKFSSDNRFSFFSSTAGAWKINKEKFMENIDWVSNLKLRIGWGQTGNQAIDAFSTQNIYTNGYYGTYDASVMVAMYPSLIANKDLIWETTDQTNFGVDIGLFNDRLSLSIDAYYKITHDILQKVDAPLSSGFPTISVNRGSIENKGVELSLDGYILNKKDYSWKLGGNISFNSNKILKLGISPSTFGTEEMVAYLGSVVANDTDLYQTANIFIQGRPVGLFWGYKTDGIFQDDAEASQYTYSGSTMTAGDVKYVDQDNNYGITATDKVVIGDPNPDFVYGITSVFTYKKFTLNAYFYGTYGNDILNANLIKETGSYTSNNIRSEAYYKAWRAEQPSNEYPKLGTRFQEISDRFIEDGSFFRLGSLTLSYNLDFKNKKAISSIDLSVTGRNLFTITKYSGYNPEVNSFANDPTRIGIDFGGYPAYKSISFGISLNF